MTWVAAAWLVVGFLLAARLLGLPDRAAEVFARSRAAVRDMRDPALDELEKEKRVQRHALRMLALFAIVTLGLALALAAPLAVVWGLELLGAASVERTLELSLSGPFLLAACVVTVAALPLLRQRRSSDP
ncbi:MAG: hypothetical protein IPM29_26080 [Planctomycetes bacterium]|nr:hypothetical protein [Planctomycetota bacterium]